MNDALPTLPPEFDANLYRMTYPDLQDMSEVDAAGHFTAFGRQEGRVASPAATREHFLSWIRVHQKGKILEVGPFCNPQMVGADVAYLDVLDAAGLRKRAEAEGIDVSNCPETIDYVGSLESVTETFDAAFSSHSIEHHPDLVSHLLAVSNALKPGGRYYLIISDKRYCFNAFVPEATPASVLQAYTEHRKRHTQQSVIEHRALTTHNDALRHWAGDNGDAHPADRSDRVKAAIGEFEAAKGRYLDVHGTCWTPEGFRETTDILYHLALTDLMPIRVYSTPRDRLEFCAVLEKR